MKYRVTQPFIAFGKTPKPGDVVELTEEQAALLAANDCIVEYEMKVMPKPENKTKKASGSSRRGQVRKKTTRKSSKKSAKK